jgi:iron(III) transport system substrate-binding protein
MTRTVVAWLAGLSLIIAACSSSDASADTADSATSQRTLEDVYGELEGLSGAERTARLVELAAEEDADITLYTSLSIDDSGPLTEAFTEQYDIGVDLYRASGTTVTQRLLQEAAADFAGADVVLVNGTEMVVLDAEGLIAPLTSPVTDDLLPSVVFDNWAGVYVQVFAAAWNTDLVDPERAPQTWEAVLSDYSGALAMELGDFDWFATLVEDYFIAEQGLTEDEAVALFTEAAKGSLVVDGHTLMAELLAGGGFDVAASPYQHRIQRLLGDGAPVAWEPAVQPLVARPNGIAVHKDTDTPATSLLFVEWVLSDGQPMMIEFGRTPTSQRVEGGIPPGYDVLTVDLAGLLEEREKWEGLYESIVSQSGQAVIDE